MRIVLQRVKRGSVSVAGNEISSINKGYVLLVGIGKQDNIDLIRNMALKISRFRVFEDSNGKMNLDINDSGGEILSVPQFTLLGDVEKGNRPGFDNAAPPFEAKTLWMRFNDELRALNLPVKEGEFGAHMEVDLINDGPVTFFLENA